MSLQDPWLPAPDQNGYVSPARQATPITVCRITPAQSPGGAVGIHVLPSLACIAIEESEGPLPPVALFRYKFDGLNPASPQNATDAMSTLVTQQQLQDLVEIGDQIAVYATRPDGAKTWIFHGQPLKWTMRLARDVEQVIIHCTSVAKNCWNEPVGGALYRDASDPEALRTKPPGTPNDYYTHLVPMMNPKGVPNATPSTCDSGSGGFKYPVFLDPLRYGTDANGEDYPRMWDIAMACAHLIFVNNDQTWVKSPKRSDLDSLLIGREPIQGKPFDPTNPNTFNSNPIQAPDLPLCDRPWPMLVYQLIRDSGFAMKWPLTADTLGNPTTRLRLFLKQGATPKSLWLQARGSNFDPTLSNTNVLEASRDLTDLVNQWRVQGGMKRYEASFILAPGFPSQSSDVGTLDTFDLGTDGFATTAAKNAYRLFVFDEAGDGCYGNASTTLVTGQPTSLDAVLGAPDTTFDPPEPQYIPRLRPPIGQLFTQDVKKRQLRYELAISTDYLPTGNYPKTWDGTGNWQVVQGGFHLLKDRIGIWISCPNPNAWNIGPSKQANVPYPDGKVNVVEAIASPSVTQKPFVLRLTVVIEGDKALSVTAYAQDTSPVAQPIERVVDARDRLFYQEISMFSAFNNTATAEVFRDDTDLATAEAEAQRTATEAGVMEMSPVVIPRFTQYYHIGDRIDQINGRNLGLRTDLGGPGYAPVLPMVVGVRWELDGVQRTTLTLSDAGLDRRKIAVKAPSRGPIRQHKESRPDADTIRATWIKI